uniref:Uncharacterized protein n=1 Tax=Anguilla anguilla TaxID=7936 RepID=A0A0E9XJH4_ANGAN
MFSFISALQLSILMNT